MFKDLNFILYFLLFFFLLLHPAFSQDRDIPAVAGSPVVESLRQEGKGFQKDGFYHLSIVKFQRALKEADTPRDAVLCLMDLGWSHQLWRKYTDAENDYRSALNLAKQVNDPLLTNRIILQTGSLYKDSGRFDESMKQFETGLINAEKENLGKEKAAALYHIGEIFQAWGAFDKAHIKYQESLSSAEQINWPEMMVLTLNALGDLAFLQQNHGEAGTMYEKALALNGSSGKDRSAIVTYRNLGKLFSRTKEYEKAVEYYRKSIAISQTHKDFESSIKGIQGIGRLKYTQGEIDEAINFFTMALLIAKEHHFLPLSAELQHDIGVCEYQSGRFDAAIEYFNASIEKKEELRLTAEGALRRDYLSSQIDTYHWLTSAYIKTGAPDQSFNTTESATAKYLIEQLGHKNKSVPEFEGIQKFAETLPEDCIVIRPVMAGGAMAIATKEAIRGTFFDIRSFAERTKQQFEPFITSALEENREGIALKQEGQGMDVGKEGWAELDRIIRYYRILLSSPNASRKQRQHLQAIGKELYALFFTPVEDLIASKKRVVIVPDGILNFLPFETLIHPDDTYLVETHMVQYIQSLSVASLIKSRRYSPDRKTMAAFGGAVYAPASYPADMMVSESLLAGIRNDSILAQEKGQSVRSAFEKLGIAGFDNLPATLAEVQAIKQLLPDAAVYTGPEVVESKIKILSAEGNLKRYKTLHFATHGLVVPEIPELSSLVLSEETKSGSGEDGFLTMREIAGLDLNADFVNLSACQTGLGKLYGGEGVVGLSQAFLIAGANSLSVSLWPVADESTMQFMAGLYELIIKKNMPYAEAMCLMKNTFINSSNQGTGRRDFSHPFFWAPFVYYGN